jgi:hypothetical protein
VIEGGNQDVSEALGNGASAEDGKEFIDGQLKDRFDEEAMRHVWPIVIIAGTCLPVLICQAWPFKDPRLIYVIDDEL